MAAEIKALAGVRVGDVVDPERVRRVLRPRSAPLFETGAVADLLSHAGKVVERSLAAKNVSLLGLLDAKLAGRIESLLEENPVLSAPLEDFVESLMGQEFVQGLFTDIIYTSLVSFNQRLNPLFGRIAMNALEEQIKSFIRLFMPMVQKEAIAFAVNRRNQSIFLDFARTILHRLLDQPLPHYFAMLSARQRRKMEGLVRSSVENPKLASLGSEIALIAWDAVYEQIKNVELGTLLQLEPNAAWLAEQITDLVVPLLALPGVFPLLASALEPSVREAAAQPLQQPPRTGRPPRNRSNPSG